MTVTASIKGVVVQKELNQSNLSF